MQVTGEQLLEEWLEDYAAAKRGERKALVDGAAADGRVYLHGHHEGSCAAVFVGPSGAVAPLVVGAHDPCFEVCVAAQRGKFDVSDPRSFPRPAVRIEEIDRCFRQITGRRVVGAVEIDDALILLGFMGTGWAVAYVERERSAWLAFSERIVSINLDLWRAIHSRRPPAAERDEEVQLPPPPSAPAAPPLTSSPPTSSVPPAPAPAPPPPPPPSPPPSSPSAAASSAAPPSSSSAAPPSPSSPSPAQPLRRHLLHRRRARNAPGRAPAAPPPPPSTSPPPAAPVVPELPPDLDLLEIRQLHRRMLGVGGDDRVELGQIFLRGLETHVDQVEPGRGRTLLALLVEGIVAIGHLGLCRNPRGTKGRLARLYTRALGRLVSGSDLGEALELARGEGWDFVTLKNRTWTLSVGELLDIRSPLHRRFVERCIPAFDLRGVPQVQAAANEPPPDVPNSRLMQALLVVFTMLASGVVGQRGDGPTAADEVQADLRGHDGQLAAVRAELGRRTEQLAAVQAERDEARANLTGRDKQLAAMRADLAARDAQLAALQAELDTAGDSDTRAGEVEHRMAQDDAQPADPAARDAQLAAVQAELDTARARLASRDAQLADVQTELDTARANGRDAQLAAVRAELEVAHASLKDRDAQLAAVQVERDEALRAVAQQDDARQTLAARDEQIVALQVERAEARRALEARVAEVAALRNTLAAQGEQMARLEAKIGRVEALRASFSALTATLPGDLNAAHSSLSAQASALPTPSTSGASTTTEPRGARGPPDGAGPR